MPSSSYETVLQGRWYGDADDFWNRLAEGNVQSLAHFDSSIV